MKQLTADFPDDKKAKFVIVRFPMPPTAAAARANGTKGRARYDPAEGALIWRIDGLLGGQTAEVSSCL